MDQDNDVGYYRRREASARRMASGSSDHAIKRIHSDMADRYAAKISEMTVSPILRIV